jgi:hypothetical protein
MNYYRDDAVNIGRVVGHTEVSKDFLLSHAEQEESSRRVFVDPASKKAVKTKEKQTTVVSPNFDAPIRYTGDTPLLKSTDKLEETGEVGINIFTLADPIQLKQYQNICDNIAKDLYILSKEDLQWDPDAKNWIVFIRYIKRIYTADPNIQKQWNPKTGQVE